MRKFGLIGFPLGHSFSRKYFREKFQRTSVTDASYSNYEIDSITALPGILQDPDLKGLNVTIPYKEAVIPFLYRKDPVVEEIGACNCIRIEEGKLTGYNTDVIGFKESLKEKIIPKDQGALILGTGGSSKAVAWVLGNIGIRYLFVSRTKSATPGRMIYEDLDRQTMETHSIIINCTPLGMSPKSDVCPPIPYKWIGSGHYLFDLVYNPIVTLFLEKGKSAGARIKNGADMLAIQAEASWEIWNRVLG